MARDCNFSKCLLDGLIKGECLLSKSVGQIIGGKLIIIIIIIIITIIMTMMMMMIMMVY